MEPQHAVIGAVQDERGAVRGDGLDEADVLGWAAGAIGEEDEVAGHRAAAAQGGPIARERVKRADVERGVGERGAGSREGGADERGAAVAPADARDHDLALADERRGGLDGAPDRLARAAGGGPAPAGR